MGVKFSARSWADTSVVFAPYYIGGREAGSIAVIGPTRMHYSRVIAGIDYLAGGGRQNAYRTDEQ